jgi:hypothetical protein
MHENSTPGRRRMPAAGRGLAALTAGLACAAGLAAGSPAQAATRHGPLAVALAAGLTAVSADSASDAWAVGGAENIGDVDQSLTVHWNGTSWAKVKSPNPGGSSGTSLTGVAAISATDAWAVGNYGSNAGANFTPLILHWNGTSWAKVAAPTLAGNGSLTSVSADSATDIWAAGFYNNSSGQSLPVLLHWNGTTWSQATAPSPSGASTTLNGVKAISATDALATGIASTGGRQAPFLLQWNGTSWTQGTIPLPSGDEGITSGVGASSSTNAWAVGGYSSDTSQGETSWHLKGTAWSQVTVPSLTGMALNGVDTRSANSAWAVGSYDVASPPPATIPLILRWNGTAWTQATTPTLKPTDYNNDLRAVTSVSAKNAWAVGGSSPNGSAQVPATIILHWNGTSWKQVKSPV